MVRATIPTMKKYPTELSRNHLAVVSRIAGAQRRGRDGSTDLPSDMLTCHECTRPCGQTASGSFPVQTTDEIHHVARIVLRSAVIDPGRHGGSLHAV